MEGMVHDRRRRCQQATGYLLQPVSDKGIPFLMELWGFLNGKRFF
jgi:hypothetical protein